MIRGKALVVASLLLFPLLALAQGAGERPSEARVLSLLEALPVEGSGPAALALRGIQPNPFSSTTVIQFTLPDGGTARLRVFDLMGGLRAELPVGPAERGVLRAQLNATGWPSGVYLASLDHKGTRVVRKLILAR